jgi:hypothetical protein
MTKAEKELEEKVARKILLDLITPNTQLGIIITSVSSSGMSRRMKVIIPVREGKKIYLKDITYQVADLCNLNINAHGEVRVGGCGMDMTFWLADYITSFLWRDKKPKGLTGNGGTCLGWNRF